MVRAVGLEDQRGAAVAYEGDRIGEIPLGSVEGEADGLGEGRALGHRDPGVVLDLLTRHVLHVVAGGEVEARAVVHDEQLAGRRPVGEGGPVRTDGRQR